METVQSANKDILRNRAELLTSAIISSNNELAKINTALQLYQSDRLVYEVKVINKDSFKEVVGVVFYGINTELDNLVQARLEETKLSVQNQRARYSEEISNITLQLSAMGII